MLPIINSISILSSSKVRIHTTGMRLDAQYNLHVVNVTDPRFFVIDPTHDNLNFTGFNTKPTVLSATLIDTTHVDILFDKELDQSMAEIPGNYFIASVTVTSAALQLDKVTVRVTTAVLASGVYSVVVYNVIDLTSNIVDLAHCTASFVVP